MHKSPTLSHIESLGIEVPENIACVQCPNAVWHIIQKKEKNILRLFCTVMNVLIDEPNIIECDGETMIQGQ